MSTYQIGNVYIKHGVLLLDRVTINSLPPDGVFELEMAGDVAGMHLHFIGNQTCRGIRILNSGSPVVVDDDDEILLMVSSSGITTLVNEDNVNVLEPTERFRTSSGNNVFIDKRRIQIFPSTAGGDRRIEVPDWSV